MSSKDNKESKKTSSKKEGRTLNLEVVNPTKVSPATSDSSGSFFSPPVPSFLTKNGEQYASTAEVNRQINEVHQSYEHSIRLLREELRASKDEIISLKTRTRLDQHNIEEADVVAELKEEVEELKQLNKDEVAKRKELESKDPIRKIVNLTRECSEIRRFCESESKAKRALEEENALLRAKPENSARFEGEAVLRKELALARQDVKRLTESNDDLIADRAKLEFAIREFREQVAVDTNELASECAELQRQLSKRQTNDKAEADYAYLMKKYCDLVRFQNQLEAEGIITVRRNVDTPPRRSRRDDEPRMQIRRSTSAGRSAARGSRSFFGIRF